MQKLLQKARQANQLRQAFGWQWMSYRAVYALKKKSGAFKRQLPAVDWNHLPLSDFLKQPTEPEAYLNYRRTQAPNFFFAAQDLAAFAPLLNQWDMPENNPQIIANQIAQGVWRYFEHSTAKSTFPPDWHANAFTGERAPTDAHWSHIGDFGHGDIKIIWEPSRFASAFTLARAYWRSGDEKYPELFWQLVEDWCAQNPPQQGVNWKCGQETSLRVMAWCFGLYAFLNSPATTPPRVAQLAAAIALSGHRVSANLDYALSQSNNHGISEGMGLWTIGALFPELREAEKWRQMGRKVLEEEGQKLIYDDGSFSQHSTNYHRVMLHDYLWSLRLGEVLNRPFSDELKERVQRAGNWLYQLQDEISGGVPCYGSNDGALILPIDNCDYQDFRPVTQAIHYLSTGNRCHQNGPWNEDLLWLFGPEALQSLVEKSERKNFAATDGGYYTLRAKSGFAFVRCGNFRHRPSHADTLHCDIWWKGQNIALDAGSYSYNAPAPWNNALKRTQFHNTVSVDGLDQMEQVSRFLLLPWLHGKVEDRRVFENGSFDYWEGSHDGYGRLPDPVIHRRAVLALPGDFWLIWDDVRGNVEHEYRLHWLFRQFPHEWCEEKLILHTLQGDYFVQCGTKGVVGEQSLVEADIESPRGWCAPYYGTRESALSWAIVQRAICGEFWTIFGPTPCEVAVGAEFRIDLEQGSVVIVPGDEEGPLIASTRLSMRQ